MEKELIKKSSSNEGITEELKPATKKEAVKQLEGIIANQSREKPYGASITLPASGGIVNVNSYKGVTNISTSEFAVQIRNKNAEFCIDANYSLDLCRNLRKESFSEATLINFLKSDSNMKKILNPRFDQLTVVFSAISNLNKINEEQPENQMGLVKHAPLRVLPDDLTDCVNTWNEQLRTAVMMDKLKKEGASTENAVNSILENMSTNKFIKACSDYGCEGMDIAISIRKRENTHRVALTAIIEKLQETDKPGQTLKESEAEIKNIGADLLDFQLRRKIQNYARSVKESENLIKRIENSRAGGNETFTQQYVPDLYEQKHQEDLKAEHAAHTFAQRKLNNLQNAEKLVAEMVADEHNKP